MTEEESYKFFELDTLPGHMQKGIYLWIEHGIKPGGFATAVLENDLVGAFSRADTTNIHRMKDWAQWLYNRAPANCWGSREKVDAWMEHRGLAGLDDKYRQKEETT